MNTGHAKVGPLTPEIAFWVLAAVISVIVLGASTPLPRLTVYQAEWRFSTATLTLISGLYTVGVVFAVFCRRPGLRSGRAQALAGAGLW